MVTEMKQIVVTVVTLDSWESDSIPRAISGAPWIEHGNFKISPENGNMFESFFNNDINTKIYFTRTEVVSPPLFHNKAVYILWRVSVVIHVIRDPQPK